MKKEDGEKGKMRKGETDTLISVLKLNQWVQLFTKQLDSMCPKS